MRMLIINTSLFISTQDHPGYDFTKIVLLLFRLETTIVSLELWEDEIPRNRHLCVK
jgi:hypothetical protein